MNKYFMNGKLIYKAPDHNTKRCEAEKWVFLPHLDFERMKANPYQEHEAIKKPESVCVCPFQVISLTDSGNNYLICKIFCSSFRCRFLQPHRPLQSS